jgi:hypothetical protein
VDWLMFKLGLELGLSVGAQPLLIQMVGAAGVVTLTHLMGSLTPTSSSLSLRKLWMTSFSRHWFFCGRLLGSKFY